LRAGWAAQRASLCMRASMALSIAGVGCSCGARHRRRLEGRARGMIVMLHTLPLLPCGREGQAPSAAAPELPACCGVRGLCTQRSEALPRRASEPPAPASAGPPRCRLACAAAPSSYSAAAPLPHKRARRLVPAAASRCFCAALGQICFRSLRHQAHTARARRHRATHVRHVRSAKSRASTRMHARARCCRAAAACAGRMLRTLPSFTGSLALIHDTHDMSHTH
jgi:hypothetical protein